MNKQVIFSNVVLFIAVFLGVFLLCQNLFWKPVGRMGGFLGAGVWHIKENQSLYSLESSLKNAVAVLAKLPPEEYEIRDALTIKIKRILIELNQNS